MRWQPSWMVMSLALIGLGALASPSLSSKNYRCLVFSKAPAATSGKLRPKGAPSSRSARNSMVKEAADRVGSQFGVSAHLEAIAEYVNEVPEPGAFAYFGLMERRITSPNGTRTFNIERIGVTPLVFEQALVKQHPSTGEWCYIAPLKVSVDFLLAHEFAHDRYGFGKDEETDCDEYAWRVIRPKCYPVE